MNQPGNGRRALKFCLFAVAGWSALSPAASILPPRAAIAAETAPACVPPVATPLSLGPAAFAAATPGATPLATPVATPAASSADVSNEGEALNAAASAEIEQLIRVVAACQSEGNFKALAQLFTSHYLSSVYGGGAALSTAEFIELGRSLPVLPVEIQSIGDLRIDPKGAVSADVVSTSGHQLMHDRWGFVANIESAGDSTGVQEGQATGVWRVDSLTPLAVEAPANARELDIKLSDDSLSPASLKAKRGEDLVLTGKNSGKDDHELLVLRLPSSMTAADLLLTPGPGFPAGVAYIGQVTIPAKSSGQLVLTQMPRGKYVIVDMLPDANGIPYLSKGFAIDLTVS